MTADPSSILDPVTGLPLDQFSGIIQQIPLGSQVFPFADLNADGRMTRQPIYGDDIIPTSALVAGQDSTGEARLGLMDTTRKLYTREAVFQNKGAAIPDGETAPVDVNVVSGGGGGGSSPTPHEWESRKVGDIIPGGGGTYTLSSTVPLGAVVLVGWSIAQGSADSTGVTTGNVSAQQIYIEDTVTLTDYYLATFYSQFYNGTAWIYEPKTITIFPPVPLDLRPNALAGGGQFNVITNRNQVDTPINLLFHYYIP